MLIIRLTRTGKRNAPSFRMVLTEKQNPVKGKFIELLGHYNPRLKTHAFKKERILYWLGQGVKCSATVHNLLVEAKIIQGPKVKTWSPKKKKEAPKPKERVAEKGIKKEEGVKEERKKSQEEKPPEPIKEPAGKKKEAEKPEPGPKKEKSSEEEPDKKSAK